MPILRPCIERPDGRGCPEYALPGGSRCQAHQTEFESRRRSDPLLTGRRGTTPEWARARGLALWRAGYRCAKCNRHRDELHPSESLHVHHVDGDANNNRQSNLLVVCSPCHRLIEAAKPKRRPRPSNLPKTRS